MDFTLIDSVQEKLELLFKRIGELKDENRTLKQKIYSLEINLEQAQAASETKNLKTKYSGLVEERDRLIMERELIRNKVKIMVERLSTLTDQKAETK